MQHIAIHGQREAEMALTTADRRTWRVIIDLSTLALLDGGPVRSDDDVSHLLIRHMSALKLSALRVIGRGGLVDEVVRLGARDLRLPEPA